MNKKVIAELSLLFVAFIWGATFVVVQNAIDLLPPILFNAIRFFLAGIIIFIVYLFQNKGKMKFQLSALFPGVILGCCLFIGYSLQTIGLLYTTPSKAGFITGLSVVMVPIISYIFLKNRPKLSAIFGSSIAAIGLYLLAVKGASSFSVGDFYVLLCTFGFAFHIIFTDIFAKRSSVLTLTTIQIFTVALLCTISSLLFEDWKLILEPEILSSKPLMFAIMITAILGTAAAFFIQTNSQKSTSPTRVAIILTMEPVFAAITSYFWIDDRLTIGATIGCIFILIGMIIAELPSNLKLKLLMKKTNKKSAF
ncbi:DMT family transporter [Heyndrickxia vini]|uniref:DMT family transporter n=1 Tax=Heyndrickxia vini TaxID=1476025 RepID=A0ABX7E722_9BACI|nr:DMT family transporter [Heyndrickxia vini]QQZ11083.1 DMT family transporter [Heyndrickxia vini]